MHHVSCTGERQCSPVLPSWLLLKIVVLDPIPQDMVVIPFLLSSFSMSVGFTKDKDITYLGTTGVQLQAGCQGS